MDAALKILRGFQGVVGLIAGLLTLSLLVVTVMAIFGDSSSTPEPFNAQNSASYGTFVWQTGVMIACLFVLWFIAGRIALAVLGSQSGTVVNAQVTAIVEPALVERGETAEPATSLGGHLCQSCGYAYNSEDGDSDGGIAAGTSFNDIPSSWYCPVCGSAKTEFSNA